MRIVTVTTDFGLQDWFVGVMKGVVLSRAAQVELVDLTHLIEPGNVRQAAFVLKNAVRWFPPGTVHLAVVDPGVGSDRRPIAVRTDWGYLVGPDNGLFSYVLEEAGSFQARRIANPGPMMSEVSRTFHGRDVFAPAAAHLAGGGDFEALGPIVADPVCFPWPRIESWPEGRGGEVVYIDRFGNLITNLPNELLRGVGSDASLRLPSDAAPLIPVGRRYADAPEGALIGVPGSTGYIEIAVHRGNAARRLGLKIGAPVWLHLPNQSASAEGRSGSAS
ncbi:MAG: SAM-dependent chlorinase/fluorinase [Verrucomicrobia bacterium]|nr:SAM-dependent chlorinase/fluorinase [Verrucomicrobiota bacterium]